MFKQQDTIYLRAHLVLTNLLITSLLVLCSPDAFQFDNAGDNKSAQFLAFLAYLVEKGCIDCIKLSYLIVGHTHDIMDQWFSVLLQVLSIASFVDALIMCGASPILQ